MKIGIFVIVIIGIINNKYILLVNIKINRNLHAEFLSRKEHQGSQDDGKRQSNLGCHSRTRQATVDSGIASPVFKTTRPVGDRRHDDLRHERR